MYIGGIGNNSCYNDSYNSGMHAFGGAMTSSTVQNCFNNAQRIGFEAGKRDGLASLYPKKKETLLAPLNTAQNTLESLLASDKLDDTQKSKIQTELNKIKAKKEELEKKYNTEKENIEKMSVEELEAMLGQIESEKAGVVETCEPVTKLAQEIMDSIEAKIKKEQEEAAKKAEKSEGSGKSSSSGSSSGSSSSSDETATVGEGNNAKEVDAKTGRPADLGDKPTSRQLRDLYNKFTSGVNRTWFFGMFNGTNHDKVNEVIQELDASNIIEFMNKFPNTGDSKTEKGFDSSYDGKKHTYSVTKNSFIGKLLADASHGEKKEWIPSVLSALMDRAEALGIDDEVAKYEADCLTELDATNISEARVGDNITQIYEAIKKKEAKNAEAVKSKADNAKAEEDKKADEAKKEEAEKSRKAKETFRKDMQEILGLPDGTLISDQIEYKDEEFWIHILGYDFHGKSFRELYDAIDKAKDEKGEKLVDDPKKYLVGKVPANK